MTVTFLPGQLWPHCDGTGLCEADVSVTLPVNVHATY